VLSRTNLRERNQQLLAVVEVDAPVLLSVDVVLRVVQPNCPCIQVMHWPVLCSLSAGGKRRFIRLNWPTRDVRNRFGVNWVVCRQGDKELQSEGKLDKAAAFLGRLFLWHLNVPSRVIDDEPATYQFLRTAYDRCDALLHLAEDEDSLLVAANETGRQVFERLFVLPVDWEKDW